MGTISKSDTSVIMAESGTRARSFAARVRAAKEEGAARPPLIARRSRRRLELELHAGGYAHELAPRPTMRGRALAARRGAAELLGGIVAVRRYRASTRSEVEVSGGRV